MKSKLVVFLVVTVVFIGCSINSRTGNISSPSDNKNSSTLINPLEYDEIVIEGTVLLSSSYFVGGMIYTSNVVEVNTIFKGEIDDKVVEIYTPGGRVGDIGLSISHGLSLAPKKSLAIFRFKKAEDFTATSKLSEITPFPVYYLTNSTQIIAGDWGAVGSEINIEKDIYQRLETEFRRKRTMVLGVATTNKFAISYSSNNNLKVPNREIGVVYKLIPGRGVLKDEISLNVSISSAGITTYFNQGEIIIEYDTTLFGDSIVMNKKLRKSVQRNYKRGNSSNSQGIPDHFVVECKDVSPNSFKVVWVNPSNSDSCLQLYANSQWINGVRLFFLSKKNVGRTGFKISAPISANTRYDYVRNKIVQYDYVATSERCNYAIEHITPPRIDEIYPNGSFNLLDTVQIRGKYFGQYASVQLYAKGTNGRYAYKRIPEIYLIERYDTLITFVIPLLTASHNYFDWVPISGSVKVIRSMGEFDMSSASRKQLIINP